MLTILLVGVALISFAMGIYFRWFVPTKQTEIKNELSDYNRPTGTVIIDYFPSPSPKEMNYE